MQPLLQCRRRRHNQCCFDRLGMSQVVTSDEKCIIYSIYEWKLCICIVYTIYLEIVKHAHWSLIKALIFNSLQSNWEWFVRYSFLNNFIILHTLHSKIR